MRKKLFTDKNAKILLNQGLKYIKSKSVTVETGEVSDLGEPITCRKWGTGVVITEAEMCDFIGLSVNTFNKYCADDSEPERQRVCIYLKSILESFWLGKGLETNGSFPAFVLQAYYSRSTRAEIEAGEKTREAAKEASLTMAEKIALLREVAQDASDIAD